MRIIRYTGDSPGTRDFPRESAFDRTVFVGKFVTVEKGEMPAGFWQTFFEAVSGIKIELGLPEGEVVAFVRMLMGYEFGGRSWRRKRKPYIVKMFYICLLRNGKNFPLTSIADVHPIDLTWDDDCTAADIEKNIRERVGDAPAKFRREKMAEGKLSPEEIEELMVIVDTIVGQMISSGV